MSTLIQAHNLSILRGGRQILNNVSLSIQSHEFITIIGPNGAGKSMLLKSLMGIVKPDHGSIIRSDKLRVGYIPQRLHAPSTFPLTVKRFLILNNTTQQFDHMVEETQISNLLSHNLYTLSGGEMQRVLLARALLKQPNLLVLDEPTQNLDIAKELQFYQLLDRLYQQINFAVLMVSHDLHLVMRSTHQVICLSNHICCSGKPTSLAQDPEFSSLFGKEMAQLMSIYSHTHDHHSSS